MNFAPLSFRTHNLAYLMFTMNLNAVHNGPCKFSCVAKFRFETLFELFVSSSKGAENHLFFDEYFLKINVAYKSI